MLTKEGPRPRCLRVFVARRSRGGAWKKVSSNALLAILHSKEVIVFTPTDLRTPLHGQVAIAKRIPDQYTVLDVVRVAADVLPAFDSVNGRRRWRWCV